MQQSESFGNLSNIASGNYFDAVKDRHKLDGLSAIRVLIVDSDIHVSSMIKSILQRLSFRTVHVIREGIDALDAIEEHDIDLVISEWPMSPTPDKDLIRTIRTSDSLRAQTVPILLLTARGDRKTVYQARDAGITEFLIKPFSVQSLCVRLVNMIENPRHFIISPEYIGPDRRRQRQKNPATSRRMNEEERQAHSTRQGRKTIIQTPQGEVHVSDPDHTLRQRIGLGTDVRELLSEESINKAQRVIEENLGQFHEWIGVDLVWIDHNFKLMQKGVTFDTPKLHIVDILLSIKAKSGMFNFPLAVDAADSLVEYLDAMNGYTKNHDIVIRKHIDVLYVIFQKYIEGDGDTLGQEMMNVLKKLKEHIPAQ